MLLMFILCRSKYMFIFSMFDLNAKLLQGLSENTRLIISSR